MVYKLEQHKEKEQAPAEMLLSWKIQYLLMGRLVNHIKYIIEYTSGVTIFQEIINDYHYQKHLHWRK